MAVERSGLWAPAREQKKERRLSFFVSLPPRAFRAPASCHNLLVHRHDLHQKSFCQLTVLFREVLWLDCILSGGYTLITSCYNLLLHRHDLHQKSFCELSVLFREVLWLDCILLGCRKLTLL